MIKNASRLIGESSLLAEQLRVSASMEIRNAIYFPMLDSFLNKDKRGIESFLLQVSNASIYRRLYIAAHFGFVSSVMMTFLGYPINGTLPGLSCSET